MFRIVMRGVSHVSYFPLSPGKVVLCRACSRIRASLFLGAAMLLAVLLSACQTVALPAAQTHAPTSLPLRPVESATSQPQAPLKSTQGPWLEPSLAASEPTGGPALNREPAEPGLSTPSLSPTPDLYNGYTIDTLTHREYGGGVLAVQQLLAENSYFTRYSISYPSDGLTITGFMNVPRRGEAPYPVVIALHGYIDPAVYQTLDYTTGYADTLARAGFLVIHPNLRGYPPSDPGENLFRVGMAVDVLNLIALVKSQGGQPGPLAAADPEAIGLWGHSMGGGISTRVITVSPDIKAAVLYAAMSGDERQNFAAIYEWSYGERGIGELSVPEEELGRISPIYFLDRIQAAVSIHHGEADELVPPDWSLDLCARLEELEKEVECFSYPDQPHTFRDDGGALFMERVVDFYQRTLR